MYVDWEYYKIFYYVAKYQNFTKAARVLGNNQPNITHSMNRLESQLNCVLFIRSNRGVTLTPEGEMLYSRIASAAVQIQDAAVLRPDTEAATTDQMLTLVKSELGLAFVPEPMAKDLLARGELVQLHLQEIIPTRSICLVYDHHRPLNTAARKFQQMMTKADSPRPAASKQTESISFISQ